jgi:hypothetical protein
MWKMIRLILLGVAIIIASALVYGARRWQSATNDMHAKLEAARRPVSVKISNPAELTGLPAPVQRYFRAALTDGQPMIVAVNLEHIGTFNMSETDEQWRPFSSTQRVITQRPGFDWEGWIAMMPGLTVRVHDAYIAGEGMLHASLFGLVSLVDLRGTPAMAQGELMRWAAEAAWYPTALLPSQGVQWDAVDATSAKATLKDGATSLTLLFRFGENDLIESVRAEERGRTVLDAVIPTAWEGHWSNYELHDGMRIPSAGEVAWMLPTGPKPYWCGQIIRIRYAFAD